jgi:hypothetical protein
MFFGRVIPIDYLYKRKFTTAGSELIAKLKENEHLLNIIENSKKISEMKKRWEILKVKFEVIIK